MTTQQRERVGVYPGSFNPPTIAHLAIARAARSAHELVRVDLAVSRIALAKERVVHPPFDQRVAAIRAVVEAEPGLGLVITEAQLIADISEGYDVVIMGADKWHQVMDPRFYGDSERARDAALLRLPAVAVVPRPPLEVPADLVLDIPDEIAEVSSTAVRDGGRHDWLAPGAAAVYRRWL
jgi:hypothetical protein